MSNKQIEQKVREFAEEIIKSGMFDGADIAVECGVIDFYKGINCYTMQIVDGDVVALVLNDRTLKFNRTISNRQLEMLEKKPELFMDLDTRYFMDNENPNVYSKEKSCKLVSAASIGLSKMPKSAEKAELQRNIMERIGKIKKETTIVL